MICLRKETNVTWSGWKKESKSFFLICVWFGRIIFFFNSDSRMSATKKTPSLQGGYPKVTIKNDTPCDGSRDSTLVAYDGIFLCGKGQDGNNFLQQTSLSLRSSSILFLKVFLSDIYGLTRRREVFVWLRQFGASFPPAWRSISDVL